MHDPLEECPEHGCPRCQCEDAHAAVIVAAFPLCESPLCKLEATTDRRGIMLCERHAAFIDRCFPT